MTDLPNGGGTGRGSSVSQLRRSVVVIAAVFTVSACTSNSEGTPIRPDRGPAAAHIIGPTDLKAPGVVTVELGEFCGGLGGGPPSLFITDPFPPEPTTESFITRQYWELTSDVIELAIPAATASGTYELQLDCASGANEGNKATITITNTGQSESNFTTDNRPDKFCTNLADPSTCTDWDNYPTLEKPPVT